jgi:hypothetical protein
MILDSCSNHKRGTSHRRTDACESCIRKILRQWSECMHRQLLVDNPEKDDGAYRLGPSEEV